MLIKLFMTKIVVDFHRAKALIKKEIILDDVTFQIHEGEFWYFLGRTGSGKSTVLKLIYAELSFEGEKGIVLNYDLSKIRSRNIPYLRRKIGMVFQDFQLLTDRNVFKNLEFVLKATGCNDKTKREERIHQVLEKVGMLAHMGKMPHQLSGGEQQKVCIARALLNEPELLLFDEPTGNLDPLSSAEVLEIILELKSTGKTIIMATHDILMVEKYPAPILWFQDQRVIKQDEIKRLRIYE